MPGGLTLLTPLGLGALLALAAIVLIHMRRRTPPVTAVPSLRFWEPATAESSDRRRLRKPPVTLPFILQLIAALVIAFALARPAMPALPGVASQRTTPEHTMIVLDGSTSMLGLAGGDDSRTRWNLARDEAEELLDEWQAGDVVTMIVAGSRLETTSASTRQQVDRLGERVASMEAPGGIADIDAALELSADLVLPDRSNRLVLITDGAVRVNPEVASLVAAPIELQVVGQVDEAMPNVAVTSIGSRPIANRDDTYRLSFAISSFAPEAVRLPYRVQADGVDVVASEIDLAAAESRSIEVTLPQGARTAEVVIDVSDSFAADNRATVLLGGSDTTGLDILLISDNPSALERALGALPEARVDVFPTTTPGIRALATGFDLVVFQGISPLPDDIPDVPMLFVRPTQLGERFATRGVLTGPSIDRIDAGADILDGVEWAGVTFGDTPAYLLGDGEEELVRGTANGVDGPLVWRGDIDGSPYVAYGFDLESSNITQRVAFPVLIARSVADLATEPVASTLGLGEPLLYEVTQGATTVSMIDPGGDATLIDALETDGPILFEATGQAGRYTLTELGAGEQVLDEVVFVVNAGHPVESDLRPNDALAESLAGAAASDEAVTERRGLADIWPLLVAIAGTVIALEWLAASAGWLRLPSTRGLARSIPRFGGRS
ncbi:MAG: VWA domain-containing protein [Chloroflexota bacterium]|nr:VWA domain-containing protein [Chloroflexota bacterium]